MSDQYTISEALYFLAFLLGLLSGLGIATVFILSAKMYAKMYAQLPPAEDDQ